MSPQQVGKSRWHFGELGILGPSTRIFAPASVACHREFGRRRCLSRARAKRSRLSFPARANSQARLPLSHVCSVARSSRRTAGALLRRELEETAGSPADAVARRQGSTRAEKVGSSLDLVSSIFILVGCRRLLGYC